MGAQDFYVKLMGEGNPYRGGGGGGVSTAFH